MCTIGRRRSFRCWCANSNCPFATVLTIHHLAEQGSFWGLDFDLTNLPERYFKPRGVEYFGRLNLLKGGIVFADKITTVSERYRREMLNAEGGLRARHRVCGSMRIAWSAF